MKKKRILALLLTAALTASLLAGCGMAKMRRREAAIIRQMAVHIM